MKREKQTIYWTYKNVCTVESKDESMKARKEGSRERDMKRKEKEKRGFGQIVKIC